MRIAWFSSSKKNSRSSFFTDQIAPILESKNFSIDRYSEDGLAPLSSQLRHEKSPYDIFFYQVEEGQHCHWVRTHLGTNPGVVLFHDALFTDYGPDPITNSSCNETVRKFHENSYPWPSRENEYKREGYIAAREMALSIVPIFSTARGVHECRSSQIRSLGGKNVYFIPEPIALSEIISIPTGTQPVVIGLCGRPRIEDRVHKIFQGVVEAQIPYKILWLIDSSDKPQAEELLREFSIKDVDLIEGKDPYRWQSLLPSIHVPIHTRFSVFESTSPYLQLSMASARNCIVTNFGDEQELSESCVYKIDPGDCEARMMREYLLRVTKEPSLLINEQARTYAYEVHHPQTIAAELALVFTHERAYLGEQMKQWENLMKDAYRAVLEECVSFEHHWNKDNFSKFIELVHGR